MAERVCPVWVGYLLASPLRKLFENPSTTLAPYVKTGMTVLDVGCAMGFFSIPLARMVGTGGRVVCVDIQAKMLQSLARRARRARVSERIETRLCGRDSLDLGDLAGRIDFALAYAVVHEVPDPARFFAELREAMKPEARLLVAEPKGHVSDDGFARTVSIAEEAGFAVTGRPKIRRSRSVLLERKQ